MLTSFDSMSAILEVKNLSKKYQISHRQGGYVALRDVLAAVLKHPLAFLGAKTKAAVGRQKKEEFWALKDVNFDVYQGEVIGIIGHNGAGKSTLLKILSKITPPTTGEIRLRGRVGSLLEVGTGFHPELTGRENIYMNGAILGMLRSEIIRKFDAIVEFAGIEKFIDTPVKFYSSGMYTRLAFSVAAHMEPDILIIDEVLAVGDAEFQKKCLGKMEEVTKKEGRTILFVSHNMTAIKKLCQRCVVLDRGQIVFIGETEKALAEYTHRQSAGTLKANQGEYNKNRRGSGTLSLTKINILDKNEIKRNTFEQNEVVRFNIEYEVYQEMQGLHVTICFFSSQSRDLLLTDMRYEVKSEVLKKGEKGSVIVEVQLTAIRPGEYPLYFWIGDTAATKQGNPLHYDVAEDVVGPLIIKASTEERTTGCFTLPSRIVCP